MPKEVDNKRQRLFLLLTLVFPIVFFILFEGGLRLLNYGRNLELFIPIESGYADAEYLKVNPAVAHRYFSQSTSTPLPPHELFLNEKPQNAYRIFVLGGSSAAGWPYPNNVMFSRILNRRLSDAFLDKTIEIVNTGITAINSHSLLDFMTEVLDQGPDAILIYAGHNEFYGALGAASTESLGNQRWIIRAYLRLLHLKTVQWLRDIFNDLRSWTAKLGTKGSNNPRYPTLMGQMIGEQNVPYDGEIYRRAKQQFRENLEDILQLAKNADFDVMVSEVVSNLRDIVPFVSNKSGDEEPADIVFRRARNLKAEGQYELARATYYRIGRSV